ncbi:hypothetical protein P171DRAFT_492036 [Karstenula rhodostoma CBS 690.94]|uniref:Uncharacterized protein n=1 Tax=Karstenula rhodostoma CBS 690.94 TaxID=1392251 RepID=A0A9P4P3L3_9PLEO|nr:hypothetical protein P171DRAFT_492036 [Karstenula rhodostoma CBS 690.94]
MSTNLEFEDHSELNADGVTIQENHPGDTMGLMMGISADDLSLEQALYYRSISNARIRQAFEEVGHSVEGVFQDEKVGEYCEHCNTQLVGDKCLLCSYYQQLARSLQQKKAELEKQHKAKFFEAFDKLKSFADGDEHFYAAYMSTVILYNYINNDESRLSAISQGFIPADIIALALLGDAIKPSPYFPEETPSPYWKGSSPPKDFIGSGLHLIVETRDEVRSARRKLTEIGNNITEAPNRLLAEDILAVCDQCQTKWDDADKLEPEIRGLYDELVDIEAAWWQHKEESKKMIEKVPRWRRSQLL